MTKFTQSIFCLIASLVVLGSVEALIELPFMPAGIKPASADSKIPLSVSRVVIDGFIPQSVGRSPSNQQGAHDPFRYFQVLLPYGYDDPINATRRYPVFYFLHGFGLDYSCYGQLLLLFSEISEFIVVKVDASVGNGYLGSFYTNSSVNGYFQDYVANELPDYINANYRTDPSREANILFGHSMGAFGALLLAVTHPERFGTVYAFSPPPIAAIAPLAEDPTFYENVRNEIPKDGHGAGRVLPMNGPHSYQLFTWAAALSPNLDNPFAVDLPIVVDCNFYPLIIDGMLVPNMPVIERWKLNDPYTLFKKNQEMMHATNIFIAFSTSDPEINRQAAHCLDRRLNRLEIPHIVSGFPGKIFAQVPQLIPYSPSNDIPLALVFPTLQMENNFLIPAPKKRPCHLVDLVVKALQTDATDFSNISLANFAPFLNFCGITPPATIGKLFVDPDFRTCLKNHDINPDIFIGGYFEVTALLNIDPFFFGIDQDGLGSLID